MYLTQMREKFQKMEGLLDPEIESQYAECWAQFEISLQALMKHTESAASIQAKISQILENNKIDFESTESIRGALDTLLSFWKIDFIQTNKICLDTLKDSMTKDPAISEVLSVCSTVKNIRVQYDNKTKEWSDFFDRLKHSMVQATSSLKSEAFESERQSELQMFRAVRRNMMQFLDDLATSADAFKAFSDAWSDLLEDTQSMLLVYHKKQTQYATEFFTLCKNTLDKTNSFSLDRFEEFRTELDQIQKSVGQPLLFEDEKTAK